jgi:hypothetical protein
MLTSPAPICPKATSMYSRIGIFMSGYADGRYSADGQYGGLPSSIGVTVTLDRRRIQRRPRTHQGRSGGHWQDIVKTQHKQKSQEHGGPP